ncbi:acyltransferase family protein [Flavobacterium sp. TSSA_36]|uniref:acyltransferase family protein n=1 Tax=Flavobacterium sp. TSSA_36 TaxID=3447669 RepID=UPI003F3DDBD0
MTKDRLLSLDIFRGFTILLMTIVNNPGSWSAIYPPLEHAEWNGCTPTDLVFPFFIFIMGTAIPFAMPEKTWNASVFQKIVVRSIRIFCLGLFLNFFSKIALFGLEGIALMVLRLGITFLVAYALLGNFSLKVKSGLAFGLLALMLFLAFSGIEAYREVRIPGVLQRIAIVYFFAALLYLKREYQKQILTACVLLLGYWAIMTLIPVPGVGPANLDKGSNLAAWLDNTLLNGHLWDVVKTWDPEGILSTLPAIASGIIGMLIGQLFQLPISKIELVKKIAIYGLGLLLLGVFWDIFFPINKSLWTSSYAVYTAGIASLCLIVLYYIIDVKRVDKWCQVFLFWGVNPMIVFFFSGIIPRVLSGIQIQNPNLPTETLSIQSYLYDFIISPCFENPMNASLAYALSYATFWCMILWILFKKKLIFKV